MLGCCVVGMNQMFSQGTAGLLLDMCSDYWDGSELKPLNDLDRYAPRPPPALCSFVLTVLLFCFIINFSVFPPGVASWTSTIGRVFLRTAQPSRIVPFCSNCRRKWTMSSSNFQKCSSQTTLTLSMFPREQSGRKSYTLNCDNVF